MIRQLCPKAPLYGAFAASLFVAAVPAMAGEAAYCVTCTGPDQTYVCRVDAGGSKPSDALKLYCVVRTAKEGHHASCAAERYSPGCNGVEKVYSYDGPLPEDIASDPRIKNLTDKIEQNQKAFEKPKGDAPNTLVELTGRAVAASQQGWRNVRGRLSGSAQPADEPLSAEATPIEEPDRPSRMRRAASAVSGFARTSYHCLISLFFNCSGE